ncbi:MAG TPA: ABC transporter ATP-binding protein [Streptosporangiales bacterium]
MNASPQASIEITGLGKSYGDAVAVRDFDLRVEPGEFVSLLGPSGSGKTSVLMMVAGFVAPTSGDVLVNDRSIVGLPPHRRGMGVVFQNYALFPHRTVAENVAFPLRMRRIGRGEIRDRVARALDLVGLGGFAERRPAQLSGGQQQRVALARALVFEPPVLLMDEPLGALDRKLREQLQVEIKEIQRRVGVTVLFVTHDQGEALGMSHRIAVMSAGRLVQEGTPGELYRKPADTFVASFLGDANLLPARMTDGELVSDRGLRLRVAEPGSTAGSGVVVVRPESICVDPGDEGYENVHHGTVRDVLYLGATNRVTVDLAGHRVVAHAAGSRGPALPRPGDRVRLAWYAADAVVVPEADAVPTQPSETDRAHADIV